jgi:AcrR family transcriptional regulator
MTIVGAKNARPIARRRHSRGEGALLRDELLHAAVTLLHEKGHEDRVSINAVVARVGVTPPALYAHFADKADLFREVHAQGMADFGEFIEARVRKIRSPIEQLHARGLTYLEYAMTHPDSYRSLFMSPCSPDATAADLPIRMLSNTAYAGLLSNVERCHGDGSLPIAHSDIDRTARGFWAIVHGCASIALAMPAGFDPYGAPEMLQHLTRAYISGLGARQ